nr:LuxR C-terminal-related transcriptional regulator [Kibdelosporangium sp. MJ126-NF4]CEL13169.1 Signal transduction response regulator / Disease resistance domain-containing protein [Kibdelosporangium sp. MJ126-NF4]CTQ98857.1 Signal transduction response regulator / Disease resistance domain-containing protein [Kibdelosporangium sp. MJ126-NF4]
MTRTHPIEVSEREAEVLAAVGARLSNAQIANRLHISVRTVESHVSSLLRKYGATDRWDLADQAQRGTPPPGHLAGLPVARTTFVGRSHECDLVVGLLADVRLVTLLGPGGIGKTRLAAVVAEAVAPSFPLGGAFVDLVPVRDGFVERAVAAAIGVTERPGQTLADSIAQRLGRGRSLLVLDNCEHLIDAAAAFVERLLSTCPDVTVLVTSRERTGVPGERTVPVEPLPLASDAERLFRDRATAADPGFTAGQAVVVELCGRLDGLPLAIELAAARSASLGPDGLLAALDDSLLMLAGGRGPVERHRSLRAVLDWSHDLLAADERELFRRLSVFASGFDLTAVAAVVRGRTRGAVADVLGRLVDKSLVVHQGGARSRWRLLETVRTFAAEQLDASGERAEVRQRHLHWAAAAAAELETRLDGEWRGDFDAVVDDLRGAVAAAPGQDVVPHQLARSLGHLSYARRFLHEAPDHYEEAARRALTPKQAAEDLRSAADGAHAFIDTGRAFQLLLASAEQARAAGDGNTEAIALAFAVTTANRHPAGFTVEVPHERLRALLDRATAIGDHQDRSVAAHLAAANAWNANGEKVTPEPALVPAAVATARATGDPVLISAGLDGVGIAALAAGRFREAHRVATERMSLLDDMSRDDPYPAPEITDTYHMAATCAVAVGDLRTALSVARLAAADDLVGSQSAVAMSALLPALVLSGDLDEAVRHGPVIWDVCVRADSPLAWVSPAVASVALAHGLLDDEDGFLLWRARAEQVAGDAQARYLASYAAFVDARVALHTGQTDNADVLTERALVDFPRQDWHRAFAHAAGAELAVASGLPDAADRLAAASATATENDWATTCLTRARGRLDHDADALTTSLAGWDRIGARFEHAYTLRLSQEP